MFGAALKGKDGMGRPMACGRNGDGSRTGRPQSGFTYLGLLFSIALVGLLMASVGLLASTERQRERESELLFVGNQIRQAIGSYYENSPGLVKRYPARLDELLKDDRFLKTRRHLRQIYPDPMTGSADWELIPAPEGGIMGVRIPSQAMPMKQSGFSESDSAFENAKAYSEWAFVYRPIRDSKSEKRSGSGAP